MHALVLVAIHKPYSFIVLAIFILIFGFKALFSTPTDVFPSIGIPTVAAVWSYTGLMPEEMSGRIVYYYERSLTATVANIEHIESGSFFGRGIVKIFFQPGTDPAVAQTQVTSVSQTILKQLPRGATPPLILTLDASSVPVLSLQISNPNMTGSEIYNMASNLIRPQLVSVAGAAIPNPYGGLAPDVMVDLDPIKLVAHRLSPVDVADALNEQNIVLPGGDIKIGHLDLLAHTNAAPLDIEAFNAMPIKQVGNSVIYLRDVAHVHKGGPPQQNAVLVGGHQAVMIVVLKSGKASTLDVVKGIKALLPSVEKTLPEGTKIKILTDASGFVKESVMDVAREMATAALLTSLVVLLFLGSWRVTLIVATSIPLSMLCALIGLNLAGQSINIMTLGGLALAVGILVDDATVMVENIDAHLHMGKDLGTAIVDAANQIVLPTLVATTCICIVWLPLFTLSGISGWLFLPMAEAIIFAMVTSFILSRTLVPCMANFIMKPQGENESGNGAGFPGRISVFFRALGGSFNAGFERFKTLYQRALEFCLRFGARFVFAVIGVCLLSCSLFFVEGRNFFPEIRGATLQLHMRAPIGTRIERAGEISGLVEREIRRTLRGKVGSVLTNCGLPFSQINQAMIPTPTAGSQDCDITVALKDSESPVSDYRRLLRKVLTNSFPGTAFTFQPGDLTEKILNFGLPAPIDVQVMGRNLQENHAFAEKLARRMRMLPGLADVVIEEPMTTPTVQIDSHRSFAMGTGATERDMAMNALLALSGSGQVGQTYYLNRAGTSQLIDVQVPATDLQNLNQLKMLPVDKGDGNPSNQLLQILGGLSYFHLMGTPGMVSHYNILPVFNIYAMPEKTDLGTATREVKKLLKTVQVEVPKGASLTLRGQAVTMEQGYRELISGLILSVAMVYLIIVVNFQSWRDPLIIISALPAALSGIAWALFVTRSGLSVPALTGAIMCMGTATANSILVVSFARERLEHHGEPYRAALEAGVERLRPVLMTALAMIIGMIPMALSNSTNAPLGRAVIGGLCLATGATLLFVPCVFAMIHGLKLPSFAIRSFRRRKA